MHDADRVVADAFLTGRLGPLAALGTGATIAGYTVVDGLGVRVSGDWLAYTAAMFTFHLCLPAWVLARRGAGALRGRGRQLGPALAGGLREDDAAA